MLRRRLGRVPTKGITAMATETETAGTGFRTWASFRSEYDHSTHTYTHHHDDLGSFEATRRFASIEEAQAFVSQFPKSLRIKALRLGGGAMVRFTARFYVNEATGEKNEASIDRVRKFIARFTDQIDWVSPFGNSFERREDFERSFAAEQVSA